MRSQRIRNSFSVALLLAWSSGQATAGLVTYTNETDFHKDFSQKHFVNFDSDSVGTPIADGAVIDLQYQSPGLDFNSFNGGVLNALADSNPEHGIFAVSSPNQMRTVPHTHGGGGFELRLDVPVSAVGMLFGDVEFPGSTIAAFDSNGQSLGSIDIQGLLGHSPYEWKFLGLHSTGVGIAQLQISYAGNDFITVDNLRVGNIVPEPASVALLLAAASSLASRRRQRTTKS
jgi:hypothetical protein